MGKVTPSDQALFAKFDWAGEARVDPCSQPSSRVASRLLWPALTAAVRGVRGSVWPGRETASQPNRKTVADWVLVRPHAWASSGVHLR